MSSYTNKTLQSNETIIYKAKVHWFVLILPVFLLISGLLFYPTRTSISHYTGLAALILGAFYLVKKLLLKTGAEYVITNKRIILKSGIFSHDALELLLDKCEGLRVKQSLTGRLFNFGTITVTTGGAANQYTFVSDPLRFKREINAQIG